MIPRAVRYTLAAWASLIDLLAIWIAIGAFVAVAALTSGCGTTTLSGVAIAAKPILDTTCAGARVACRLIDSACSAYEDATAPLSSEETSGGEAP